MDTHHEKHFSSIPRGLFLRITNQMLRVMIEQNPCQDLEKVLFLLLTALLKSGLYF